MISTVAAIAWLHSQIKAEVQALETVQYIVSQDAFRVAVADLAEKKGVVDKALLLSTLNKIKLVAKPREDLKQNYVRQEESQRRMSGRLLPGHSPGSFDLLSRLRRYVLILR
jgi:hypothetical protein